MRDHLHLFINGQPQRVDADDALTSLSDYLRRRRGLVGTKVVCAEGDCGSCAMLVGRVEDGQLRYRAVTSCILRMLQLDATHVVTVEGLQRGDPLNAIQEQLACGHGAQCGFCTPGFVVSLYDLMHDAKPEEQPLDAPCIRRQLTGNLCRCTGYDAIVQSALATDPAQVPPLDELYPPADLIASLTQAAAQNVALPRPAGTLHKPATLDAALATLADADKQNDNADITLLAGGTDLGVLVNKGRLDLGTAVCIAGLAELGGVSCDDDTLVVGAGALLSELETAVDVHLPELGTYLDWFGSPLIRSAGTVAGNLCTASPIGDLPPALYVLNAQVELASAAGRRTLSVEDFQTGYRTTQLRPDELMANVRIPLPAQDEVFKIYKVSKRKDLDISSVSAAFWLKLDGNTIADARIAYGGVGPRVLRLPGAEAALRGAPLALETFQAAARAAADAVTPMSDVRGGAAYRTQLTHNLVLKLYHGLLDHPHVLSTP